MAQRLAVRPRRTDAKARRYHRWTCHRWPFPSRRVPDSTWMRKTSRRLQLRKTGSLVRSWTFGRLLDHSSSVPGQGLPARNLASSVPDHLSRNAASGIRDIVRDHLRRLRSPAQPPACASEGPLPMARLAINRATTNDTPMRPTGETRADDPLDSLSNPFDTRVQDARSDCRGARCGALQQTVRRARARLRDPFARVRVGGVPHTYAPFDSPTPAAPS
ncbi:MAG: hypothetical protein RLZZ238_2721 [Planctomycetota bacterium]